MLSTVSPITPEAPRVAISFSGVTKTYGDVVAVDDLHLDIHDGEFFSMLGPSGSGKTTVLRLIAGFEQASAGRIDLDGEDVTATAPFDRNVNTVFQDYALFPHLSVLDNVAYGLRVRKVGKRQRHALAREALATVRLEHLAARRPHQLSGGQRQRVALARAIVVHPKVLLLDEPLGALDLKLREQMQVELKQLQRNLGITFVFVTHDQEEALTLSDRVAVFNEGRIEQLGSPAEIYEQPRSSYVAQFVGTSNLFDVEASQRLFGRSGSFALRPEKVTLRAGDGNPPTSDGNVIRAAGVITESIYLGTGHRVHVQLADGTPLVVLEQSTGGETEPEHRGESVVASWSPQDLVQLREEDAPVPAAESLPAS
jgi:putative spermidine/putrescine transport system ATP-binding protein